MQACEKLRKVYDDEALKERQCQYRFTRFYSGDYSVKDAPRSGRPSEVDDEKIRALVEANRHSTIRELAEILKISIGSVHIKSKHPSEQGDALNLVGLEGYGVFRALTKERYNQFERVLSTSRQIE